MAKQVIVTASRQETELTDEQAGQYILENVFTRVGDCFMTSSFFERVKNAGLEESQASEIGKLVNGLIDEGKLQIRFEYNASFAGGPGYVLNITRIA